MTEWVHWTENPKAGQERIPRYAGCSFLIKSVNKKRDTFSLKTIKYFDWDVTPDRIIIDEIYMIFEGCMYNIEYTMDMLNINDRRELIILMEKVGIPPPKAPPPDLNDIYADQWIKLFDNEIVVFDKDNRCWNYNGYYYCGLFGFDANGNVDFDDDYFDDNGHYTGEYSVSFFLEHKDIFERFIGGIRGAVAYTWTDNVSGNTDWSDQGNWNDGASGIPDGNDDTATFDGTWTSDCTFDTPYTIGQISLSTGYSGNITMGAHMNLDDAGGQSGQCTINAGTLTMNGYDISCDGTFSIGSGGILTPTAGADLVLNNTFTNQGTITNGGGTNWTIFINNSLTFNTFSTNESVAGINNLTINNDTYTLTLNDTVVANSHLVMGNVCDLSLCTTSGGIVSDSTENLIFASAIATPLVVGDVDNTILPYQVTYNAKGNMNVTASNSYEILFVKSALTNKNLTALGNIKCSYIYIGGHDVVGQTATFIIGTNTVETSNTPGHSNDGDCKVGEINLPGVVTISTGALTVSDDLDVTLAGTITYSDAGVLNVVDDCGITGTITESSATVSTGDITIQSTGVLTATSANHTFTGNFDSSYGGTYTHSNGTAIFTATSGTVNGTVTWYNIYCGTSPGDTQFNADQTIVNNMTIGAGDTVTLNCNANDVALIFTKTTANPILTITDDDALRAINNTVNKAGIEGNVTKEVQVTTRRVDWGFTASGLWETIHADYQTDQIVDNTSTIEFTGNCTIDLFSINGNGTATCTTANTTITTSNGFDVLNAGIIQLNGASGQNIILTGLGRILLNNGCTIDLQYLTINTDANSNAALDAQVVTTTITITQIDNCNFTPSANGYGTLFSGNTTFILTNSTISGSGTQDIYGYTGFSAILDTCTFSTLKLQATSGYLMSKDHNGVADAWRWYGLGDIESGPSAGYQEADIPVGATLGIYSADAYATPFTTGWTADVTTNGNGYTIDLLSNFTSQAVTVSANDTYTCTANGIQIAIDAAKKLVCNGGTLVLSPVGGSGNEIDITSGRSIQTLGNSTIDLQYMTATMTRDAFEWNSPAGTTVTNLDNCSFTCNNVSYSGISLNGNQTLTVTNCAFSGGNATTWSNVDVSARAGYGQFYNCTMANDYVGFHSSAYNPFLMFKDIILNYIFYGLTTSEILEAGYRAADVTGNFETKNATVYGTSFNSSYTLGANMVNVDDITVDASTTFDTSGTNYTLTGSGECYINGTLDGEASEISVSSMTITGGIYDATSGITYIGDHEVLGYNFRNNGGTFIHNDGILYFRYSGRGGGSTTLDFGGDDLYDIVWNTTDDNAFLKTNTTITHNLTVTSGGFTTYEVRTLSVTGDVVVGGELGSANVAYTFGASSFGSLYITGTYYATPSTTTITSESIGNMAFDNDGTLTANSGLIKFTYGGATAVDFVGTGAGDPYDVELDNAALDLAVGAGSMDVAHDLTVTNGRFNSNVSIITVTNDVVTNDTLDANHNQFIIGNDLIVNAGTVSTLDVNGRYNVIGDVDVTGTLNCSVNSQTNSFGSLTIQATGIYDATTGNTTITSETIGGDAVHNNGTLTHNNGNFIFTYNGTTNCYTGGDDFYNVIVANDGVSLTDVIWYESGNIINDLTINGAAGISSFFQFRSNADVGGTITITKGAFDIYNCTITCANITNGDTIWLECTAGASTLTLDNGSTLANNGVIEFYGNTVNHAIVQGAGGGQAICTGNDWNWDSTANGYVDIGRIDLQFDATTGGGIVTVEIIDAITIDAYTISLNDRFKCVIGGVIVTGNNGKSIFVYGTWEITGGSGTEITFSGVDYLAFYDGCTIDMEYMIFQAGDGNNGFGTRITGVSHTYTQMENCTFTSLNAGKYGSLRSGATDNPVFTSCTFNNLKVVGTWLDGDIIIETGGTCILDNCTLTNGNVGMQATTGYLYSHNHNGVVGDEYYYGVMNTADAPVGYRAINWSDAIVHLKNADAYSTPFYTILTINEAGVDAKQIIYEPNTQLRITANNFIRWSS